VHKALAFSGVVHYRDQLCSTTTPPTPAVAAKKPKPKEAQLPTGQVPGPNVRANGRPYRVWTPPGPNLTLGSFRSRSSSFCLFCSVLSIQRHRVLCSCRGLGGQINTRFFQSDLTPTNTTKLCLVLLSCHPSTILPGIQSYPYPSQGPRSASAGIDIGRPAPVLCSAVPLFVPSTKPRAGAGHCFLSSVSVSVAPVTIVASRLFLYAPSFLTLSTLATKSHLVLCRLTTGRLAFALGLR
jgi:hypothetical protein